MQMQVSVNAYSNNKAENKNIWSLQSNAYLVQANSVKLFSKIQFEAFLFLIFLCVLRTNDDILMYNNISEGNWDGVNWDEFPKNVVKIGIS